MSDWIDVSFDELLIDHAISYGIVQPGPHVNTGYVPMLRANNIKNGKINATEVLQVSEAVEAKYERTRLEGGELLITVVGNPGQCAIVPPSLSGHNVARAIAVARMNNEADKRYVRYAFMSEDILFQIYGGTNDTVQPTLNLSNLKALKFRLPKISTQTKIADVLASLDDKIDLLHRQNRTLEAMAETLFRQWFVENPDDDWAEQPLSEAANFLNGLACQKHPAENPVDSLPVLKIKDLKHGITDASDLASSRLDSKYIVERGDVIFAWSASLMVKIWGGQKCVLNQHLFKVTSDTTPKWFYYLWCKRHLDEFIAISRSHATTMGHIKRGDLDEATVLIPSLKKMAEMTAIQEPIMNQRIAITERIASLEKLRDTLLPKLMSGEVRVVA